MKCAVKTLQNKDAGEVTLDESIFGVQVEGRTHIVHRMTEYQRAKRRAGTHKVKQRHEIRGSGRKRWSQKGTGNARVSDMKCTLHRGGATVFGPVVRSHAKSMPKKLRKLAMKIVLSSKLKDGKLIILEEAKAKDHKTKPMAAALAKLGMSSAFIVGGREVDVNFARATANIPRIDVVPSQGANVYDILRRDVLVLTKEAVNHLTERLKD